MLGAGWLANHKENPTQTPSNWLHFAFRVYGYWAAAAPGEGAPSLYPGPAPPPQAEPPFPPAGWPSCSNQLESIEIDWTPEKSVKVIQKNHQNDRETCKSNYCKSKIEVPNNQI